MSKERSNSGRSKSIPKPRQDLKELHQVYQNLRGQLVQYAQKLDKIIQKDYQKKMQKLKRKEEPQDEQVSNLKTQLKQLDSEIYQNKKATQNYRNKLNSLKLDDYEKMMNDLKHQKQLLKKEEDNFKMLKGIQSNQLKALVEQDPEIRQLQQQKKHEAAQAQRQLKRQQEKLNVQERQNRKFHQAYFSKVQKLKMIEQKLANHKPQEQSSQAKLNQILAEINSKKSERDQSKKQEAQALRKLHSQQNSLVNQIKKREVNKEALDIQLRNLKIRFKYNQKLVNELGVHNLQKQNVKKRIISRNGREIPKYVKVNSERAKSVVESEKRSMGIGDTDINYQQDFDQYGN